MPSHCVNRWRQLLPSSALLVVVTVSSFCPTPSLAQAARAAKDRIVFLNGDISTGELKSTGDDHVVFDGQLTGSITYAWRDIKSIEVHTSAARAALRTNTLNSTLLTKVIDPDTDAIGPMESNVAELKAKASPPPPSDTNVVPHWGGSVSTQDTVTRATQDQYQLGGKLHASYETTEQQAWKHQIVSLDSSVSFSEGHKPGAPITKNAVFEGTLMYNAYLTNSELLSNFPNHYNSSFLMGFGNGYHNLSLGIDVQQSYGFGLGWVHVSRGKANKNGDQLTQVFGLQGDLRYSNLQLYTPGKNTDLAGAGLKESYSVSIPWFGPKAKPLILAESLTTIPYFNDSRSLQIRGTAQFALPLTQRLSIGPSLVDDYFRNAPHGSKQNYLQPAITLTYNFGPITQ